MKKIREISKEQPLFILYCLFGISALIFLGIWIIKYMSTILEAFRLSNAALMFSPFSSVPFILTLTFAVIAGIFNLVNGNLKRRQKMTKTDLFSIVLSDIFICLFLEFGAFLFFFIIAGYLSIPFGILTGIFFIAAIISRMVYQRRPLFYFMSLFIKYFSTREELGLTKSDFKRILGVILGLIAIAVVLELALSLYSIIAVIIALPILIFLIAIGVGVEIDREFSMNAFIKKQIFKGRSKEEIEVASIEKYGKDSRDLFYSKWKYLEDHSVFPFVPKVRKLSPIEKTTMPEEFDCADCRRQIADIYTKIKYKDELRSKMFMGMLIPLLFGMLCIFGSMIDGDIDATGRIVIMVIIFCAVIICVSYGVYMARKHNLTVDQDELGEFLRRLQASRDKGSKESNEEELPE